MGSKMDSDTPLARSRSNFGFLFGRNNTPEKKVGFPAGRQAGQPMWRLLGVIPPHKGPKGAHVAPWGGKTAPNGPHGAPMAPQGGALGGPWGPPICHIGKLELLLQGGVLFSPHSLHISHTQNRYPALRGDQCI